MHSHVGDIITLSEAAELLGVSYEKARQMVSAGTIPAVKLGDSPQAHWRLSRTALENWVLGQ